MDNDSKDGQYCKQHYLIIDFDQKQMELTQCSRQVLDESAHEKKVFLTFLNNMSALELLNTLLLSLEKHMISTSAPIENRSYSVEICVDSVQSARNAYAGGADRIELCSSLISGGLTPSIGTVVQVLKAVPNIDVHVMIRPRSGDFLYDKDEMEIILYDIEEIIKLKRSNLYPNLKGIVSGFLDGDGNVNTEQLSVCMQRIKHWNLEFTFHRAIDMSNDAISALKECIRCGVHRILTSGMAINVESGMSCILEMIECCKQNKVDDRITIAVGGGITTQNVRNIANRTTMIRHVHGTFRRRTVGAMKFKRSDMFMGAKTVNGARLSEYAHKVADVESISTVVEHIKSICE